jgi:hypothetical protein
VRQFQTFWRLFFDWSGMVHDGAAGTNLTNAKRRHAFSETAAQLRGELAFSTSGWATTAADKSDHGRHARRRVLVLREHDDQACIVVMRHMMPIRRRSGSQFVYLALQQSAPSPSGRVARSKLRAGSIACGSSTADEFDGLYSGVVVLPL